MEKDIQWDVRVVDHLRRRGVLDFAAHQAAIEELEDCAAEAEEAQARFNNSYEQRHIVNKVQDPPANE